MGQHAKHSLKSVVKKMLILAFIIVSAAKTSGEFLCGRDESEWSSGEGRISCLTDCSKYISYAYGRGEVMPCAPNLLFNEQTKDCDWPGNIPENSECLNTQKCWMLNTGRCDNGVWSIHTLMSSTLACKMLM